jgi:carbamoylphosphate synthase small subunit
LRYGHRGQNQPCKDIHTGKCVITSQNHWFAVNNETLPSHIQPWFVNINDGTNEWMLFTNAPVKSVQFHPESAPWPNDSVYLFKEFVDSL